MKVGLLTYHFSDNYGALMQAYALRRWLLERGVAAEFINYHPSYVEEGGPLDRPWRWSLWRKNGTILYMKYSHFRNRYLANPAQRAAFAVFRRQYLGVTGPRRRTVEELRPDLAGMAMLVCGSDQIWNPSIHRGLDPTYFLDIPGSSAARKVAYAPSFGRSTIEREYHAELGRLLRGLDAISVRETSALPILEAAGLRREQARVVVDPTILLGAFTQLIPSPEPTDDSLFCYALRTDAVVREVAEAAGQHLGGRIVSARSSRQRWRDIGDGVAPGPVEWLRMLARSRLVVTNSFHGVALSLVLNRPFIAVALPGQRAGLNARVQNLLALTGLTGRLINTADPAAIRHLADSPVDWEGANAALATLRAGAETYLDGEIATARKVTTPEGAMP